MDIYYSVDPDPRARFWRDAVAVRKGDTWEAKLPLLSTNQPLYAFANAYHKLPRTESLPHMAKIDELCLSTQLHIAPSAELKASKVKATDQTTHLIDDFARGWHDWYRLGAEHKPFWQNWTRKVTDPKWRGPDGASLAVTLKLPQTNRISFVLTQNEWRNYRGPKQVFTCHRKIQGQPESQTATFTITDFKNADGQSPPNWQQIDQLGLCARYEERVRGQSAQPATWNGEMPVFERVEWVK